MSKHKISELEGALLDAAVAKGEGWTKDAEDSTAWWKDGKVVCISEGGAARGYGYRPSSDWAVGGPIIDRDHIFLQPPSSEHHCGGSSPGWKQFNFWRATVSAATRVWYKPGDASNILAKHGRVGRGEGPTALVAAMRAYVASKFGEYVELP